MEENPAAAAGNPKLSNDDQTTSENPKAKRVYNTKGFKKRKAIGRHKSSGKQKQSSHNWAASREVIGNINANAQQIGRWHKMQYLRSTLNFSRGISPKRNR